MSLKKSKDDYGRANAENISGSKVPRKAGLADETTGKSAGTRDVRKVGGRFARFAGEGRS
jgi:hypothetical protein